MQKYCLVITCREQTNKFFAAFGNFYVFHSLRLFQHQPAGCLHSIADYTCFICYDVLISAGWDVERFDFSLRSLDQSNLIDVIVLLSSEPKSRNNSTSLSNIIGYIVSSVRSSNVYPGLVNFQIWSNPAYIYIYFCFDSIFKIQNRTRQHCGLIIHE